MISSNNLETQGNLREFPLAELLIEIAQMRVNGSLRLTNKSEKAVVYFDAGEVVFAVANARAFRLFEIILSGDKISREQIVEFRDFTNDFLLAQYLLKKGLLTKREIDGLFTKQIEDLLIYALDWREGDWIFSPLIRVKGDIRFKVESNKLLMRHGRSLPDKATACRFKDLQEFLSIKGEMPFHINLSPKESFVLSRFDNSSGLTIENARNLSGLSDLETLKTIYTLWLGGYLSRPNRNTAFSEEKTSEILSANINLVRGLKTPTFFDTKSIKYDLPKMPQVEKPFEKEEPVVEAVSLDDFLARVENSTNYYEILAVDIKADQAQIKQAYFSLAKRFHPDLYHKETDVKLQHRVQQAFGRLAHAYDTLRYEKSREVYDFKIRKDLLNKEKLRKANFNGENFGSEKDSSQALDAFEQGYSLLMDGESSAAIPFLARASHLSNANARFHAFYGMALASDKNQRHKAETELQTAVKLDEKNPDYRLMLSKFFIQLGLPKRAEGELNRLMAIYPKHPEAKAMLDTLQKK